jgi:uncharacterized protein (TIGR02265 family)
VTVAQEQLVFEQTIEGLFIRGLNNKISPRCKTRLKEAGLDLDRKLLPAYPFATWMGCLKIAGEEVFSASSEKEAQFRLGELMIDGYKETFLGRAVLGMIRVLGPRRTLLRSTQNFRSGNNYTESKIVEKSPTHIELWMNEVGPFPDFTAGIVHAAIRAAGATNLKVEVTGYDGHGCTFQVVWGEIGSTGTGGSGDSSAATRSGSISSR